MPANWGAFIPALASTLQSQKFTKPGGAGISYELPVQDSVVGNPANAVLKSNQADYINSFDANPLSGRYDFGKEVAQHYLDAVKNMAQTHVGELHINNGGAETLLKEGYGIAFERLLREGDIPMMDQYDEDGNLIEMGKESHPAYADFCPEVKEPDAEALAKIEAENTKAFNAFANGENIQNYNLYKFKFYQFPCLTGEETQRELEVVFATRILMGYQMMTTRASKWDYFVWVCHLGKANYNNSSSGYGGGNQGRPYRNLSTRCRNDINNAGYEYTELADNVSKFAKDAILAAHPEIEGDGTQVGNNSTIEKRIKRDAANEIEYPTLEDASGKDITPEFCPINRYKIQVAYDFEEDSQRPKILTSNVVATFTYYPGIRDNDNFGGTSSNDPYIINNIKCEFKKNALHYEKTTNWVKQKYEVDEWKKKWRRCPPEGKLKAAATASDDLKFMGKSSSTYAFLALGWNGDNFSGGEAGTQYKFEYHRAYCAVKAAENCEEPMTEVGHPWDPSGTTPGGKSFSGDPYMMMARVTIAYWYACIVKPFKPTPSAPPALIPAPLTGIYIPIYYGSANRLANNLRRAWNTGKSFATPGTQAPASNATATAVAGAYALHLLEFKLLYLGGIPTPAGPVPMVGFVPIVF